MTIDKFITIALRQAGQNAKVFNEAIPLRQQKAQITAHLNECAVFWLSMRRMRAFELREGNHNGQTKA